ncbi:MAG: hypothetical protein HQL64_00735 [Magnetococcales bacterium]|nr:hypothetical protein [Magnetococcales bacterium]
MKTGHHKLLAEEQQAQLQTIQDMTDEQIDLSDTPEKLGWSKARRGVFRPVKRQSTVRFDADIID